MPFLTKYEKDPPGFIAQMKIMLAGLDQIKQESQIREQRKEGRRAASSWRLRRGRTWMGSDYVGKVRSGQEI